MSLKMYRHENSYSALDVQADAEGATVQVWIDNVPSRYDINATEAEALAIALVQATPGPVPEYLSPDDCRKLGLALIRAAGKIAP